MLKLNKQKKEREKMPYIDQNDFEYLGWLFDYKHYCLLLRSENKIPCPEVAFKKYLLKHPYDPKCFWNFNLQHFKDYFKTVDKVISYN